MVADPGVCRLHGNGAAPPVTGVPALPGAGRQAQPGIVTGPGRERLYRADQGQDRPPERKGVQQQLCQSAHWLKVNNLRQVQYLAGHKYVSSTQRYQLTTLDDLKGELQKHHPMS